MVSRLHINYGRVSVSHQDSNELIYNSPQYLNQKRDDKDDRVVTQRTNV